MAARIVADGSDATVGIIWALFVVLLIALIAVGLIALRRYNANKQTLRSEGLGPVSATAQRLGALADRPTGTHAGGHSGDIGQPPGDTGDVGERLREITDLHDRGILDDAEFDRQRARMLEP